VKGREIALGGRVLVMGVINVTPDSFSDGGRFLDPEAAVDLGKQLISEGADLLDVGGESTRPGASPVSVEEEARRVLTVVERLKKETAAVVSVDTTKALVARAALNAGAEIINDVSAMRFDPEMICVAAEKGAGVVLMHMKDSPKDMQTSPVYADLMGDITSFLRERMEVLVAAGIPRESIVLDPGLGFGKTVAHNLELVRRLAEFGRLGRPILIGPSRKSFIGAVLDLPVSERLEGTAAAVALSVVNGASIVRVHDVRAMVRVVRMTEAIVGSAGRTPRARAAD